MPPPGNRRLAAARDVNGPPISRLSAHPQSAHDRWSAGRGSSVGLSQRTFTRGPPSNPSFRPPPESGHQRPGPPPGPGSPHARPGSPAGRHRQVRCRGPRRAEADAGGDRNWRHACRAQPAGIATIGASPAQLAAALILTCLAGLLAAIPPPAAPPALTPRGQSANKHERISPQDDSAAPVPRPKGSARTDGSVPLNQNEYVINKQRLIGVRRTRIRTRMPSA
jgi:hypothetical protein